MFLFLPGVGVSFFILAFFGTPVTSTAKYGCDFATVANHQTVSPFEAEFGDLEPSRIITFKNNEVFNTFYEKISKIFSEFKKSREYSSLGSYLRFYKTYNVVKTCPAYPGFSKFYRTYLMEKFPHDEPGGNAIMLMEKLTKQYPRLVKSAYFVTRSSVSHEGKLKDYDPTSVTLPDFFRHEQIAVVIKYRIGDNRLKGYNYILLDPEIPMETPEVFRQDNGLNIFTFVYDKVQFRILEAARKPITDSQFMTATVKHGNLDPKTYVYYFKKPYCSFIETTMKASLLGFTHTRELLDNKGESQAKLTVHIGQDGEESIYDVKFSLYDGQNSTIVTIPPMRDIKIDILIIKEKLYKLCRRLKIKNGQCLVSWAHKIKLFQSLRDDKTFLTECQNVLQSNDSNSDPLVPEENSSWEVLKDFDPETSKQKKSFKLPSANILWKALAMAEHNLICKAYGYGRPHKDPIKDPQKKDPKKEDPKKKVQKREDPKKKDPRKKGPRN